jgi:F-type H+-transporting ATPase subunit b
MEILKLITASEIVAQLICFLLLLALLRKFAWTPLLKLLDERKQNIAGALQHIEDKNKEAELLRVQYESHLLGIESEKRMALKEAAAEGKKLQDQMKKEAYIESQKILENARSMIQFELARAKEDLKVNMVDIAIKASERLIEEKLSEEMDQKLVQKFIDQLDKV